MRYDTVNLKHDGFNILMANKGVFVVSVQERYRRGTEMIDLT